MPKTMADLGYVFPALIEDLQRRNDKGWAEYGKPLLVDDERDWEQQLYEELLDALVYLKAKRMKDAKS